MRDPLSSVERSELMAKIRAKGNRSTEGVVEHMLRAEKIAGWTKHPSLIPGKPDFYFSAYRLALFVDGCFWHGCPRCARRLPKNRRKFWSTKLTGNRRRDQSVGRLLHRKGYHVMRIWEHDLRGTSWLKRLHSNFDRIGSRARGNVS
jgi:DNA mismatch endonuclease (patch repair protein)